MLRYDLHTHSLYSDGTTDPHEIAEQVQRAGLGGFALTDHDTAVGWDEARAAAATFSLDFVPGMEITTRIGGRTAHLLAYGLDPTLPALAAELSEIHRSRGTRAQAMVDRLSGDYRIQWDDLATGDALTIGRPHIADVLVRRGYFSDRSEAFARVLHPGSPYYVPTYAPHTAHMVALVTEAGGAAVLAHPAAVRHRSVISDEELHELRLAGLVGIELDHPEHDRSRVPALAAQARRLGLLRTGASDYHGAGKPNRVGDATTPKDVVDQLRERMRVKR